MKPKDIKILEEFEFIQNAEDIISIKKTECILDDAKSIFLKDKPNTSKAGVYFVNAVVYSNGKTKQYMYEKENERDDDYNHINDLINFECYE